jgi:hypothetical protein
MAAHYYYDWVQERWVEPTSTESTPAQKRQCARRRDLIEGLLDEIAAGDGITTLYAGLLARQLITTDEVLMRAYGREVVNQSGDVAQRVEHD